MESTQTQYRLLSVRNKPYHNQKQTVIKTASKKHNAKTFEGQNPGKPSHYNSNKSTQKFREKVKYQNNGQKSVYSSGSKTSVDQYQGTYVPRQQYYVQYYVPNTMGYPELLMPGYVYPICYVEKPCYEMNMAEENSPQEISNSGCPTVASEEDLNNLNGDECEVKVVYNGNIIHTESHNQQGNMAIDQSTISLSDYEDYVRPLTGNEPKSETISLPTFLL